MHPTKFSFFLASAIALSSASLCADTTTDIEEVVIEASLIPTTLRDATYGISSIGSDTIKQSHKTFVAELLTSAPNVNFSSGASRGRFFQIRGTGERSQFVDPIAPSVGYVIDGIDFSTAANIGALYDIDRVEILRGPQGTVFGSSASAGLINIVSKDPTENSEVIVNSGVGVVDGNNGGIDSHQAGVVVNGAITESTNTRIALFYNNNDGFVNNQFQNKDDTDNIEETVARGKLAWQAAQNLDILTTLFYSDVNNGYDAFTLDNVRNTISDEPGQDRQETSAVSIKSRYTFASGSSLSLDIAGSHDKTDYGYDEDWSNPTLCTPPTSCPFGDYSSFDRYERTRNLKTIDVRYQSTQDSSVNWTTGLYLNRQDIELDRTYTFASDFSSDYKTESIALYGELGFLVTDKLRFSTGLRIEDFDANYRDSIPFRSNPDETLWGGHISANLDISEELTLFSRVSRGFKAAGVNATGGNNLLDRFRNYDTETLRNYEIGGNFADNNGRFSGQLTAFYQQRHDAQIKQSQVTGTGPFNFEDYISNANETEHYGLELQGEYKLSSSLALDLSVGYLSAEFSDYTRITEGPGNTEVSEDLDGRDVAHAPGYTFSVSATWAFTEQLALWLNVEGRDSFFFSNRHDLRSNAYELINASISYSQNDWQIALWGKNLTDKDYYVRGFGSFGNDPRNGYTTEPYFQYGMPAEYGVSAEYRFN